VEKKKEKEKKEKKRSVHGAWLAYTWKRMLGRNVKTEGAARSAVKTLFPPACIAAMHSA
jgi:hypothetical protein